MSKPSLSNNTRSPQKKRLKPHSKTRKPYFFLPQNTLAFNPKVVVLDEQIRQHVELRIPTSLGKTCNNELNNKLLEKESLTSRMSPLQHLSPGPRADEAPRTSFAKAMERSMEQQSSDDSFDGVRWRSDCRTSESARPILSSPLKRAEVISAFEEIAESMGNEMTDSMLTKYGLIMENSLSQTSRLGRRRSEVPSYPPVLSPFLNRSKSFDPRSLRTQDKNGSNSGEEQNLFTGLNKWIDQFDDSNQPEPPFPNQEGTLRVAPQTPASAESKAIFADDPENLSSEDDSFLANLRVDSFASVFPEAESPISNGLQANTNKKHHSSHLSDDGEDELDPFSDELDILALNTLATQAPTLDSKVNRAAKVETEHNLFKEPETQPNISFTRPDFSRYQINSILRSSFQQQQFKRKQLVLNVTDSNRIASKIIVRGEACELRLEENDVIHVIHTSPDNHKLIDDAHNLLIWNPDVLVSSTVCADQLYCPRKTVLMKRISFPGALSIPVLLGTIVHKIFQTCMLNEKFSLDYMESLLNLEVQKRAFEIYSVGDVAQELKLKARQQFAYLRSWFIQYFKQKPKEIPTNRRQQKVKFSVSEILDVEESVWSPMFGIKGIADVTLKANLEGETGKGQFLLPMEIKTAQPHLSHQAQAALYSLLFKDRYNVDISSFLLVYSLEGSTTKHTISVTDLRSLVNLRNRISYYLKPGSQELPDLMRQQKCQKCIVQHTCMTLNYMIENGTSENSGLDDGTYDTLNEHLENREDYQRFLKYWDDLISKEEDFMSRVYKELWVMSAEDREKQQGKALANLVISKCIDDQNDTNTHLYVFARSGKGSVEPMNATQIVKYDKVIISDQEGHFALAQGHVTYVDKESITVSTRRRIVATRRDSNVFHRAQVLLPTQDLSKGDLVIFRIDKDEIYYGMSVARFNLTNLFVKDGDSKRRELIVDLRAPKFCAFPQFLIDAETENFNDDQLLAFRKISCAQDYCLVLGMPGTGKTTVISHLIKMLVAAKRTVLLTSYTNSAVDNILLKVAKLGVDFIRVGSHSRVHPEIRKYIIGSEKKEISLYKDFQDVLMSPYVVASTCLGIRDLTFAMRNHFDYCIVDEASQVSMPLSLGPLSFCDKFVLVGDHFQLPPLVTHPSLEVRQGLSKSLFQLLAIEHPDSVVELKHQYRMCEDIMAISNKLVYEDRLVCGSEEVARQRLTLPKPEGYKAISEDGKNKKWLGHLLDENNRVIFCNHDPVPAYERKRGENITNIFEVELVKQAVEALCACGIDPANIGVMTLYRSQLKLLLDSFRHIPLLEILTADRFQGRDKDCIIISMVRSNQADITGELMKDWRRINVAVTRARAKLIIFGSESTLSLAESAGGFVSLSSQKRWTYDLPGDCVRLHDLSKVCVASNSAKTGKISTKMLERHSILHNILQDQM